MPSHNSPKIVFFGTPEFAATILRHLLNEGYDIAAVVTTPDKPSGRGRKVTMSDVKRVAQEKEIPLLQPAKLKDPDFLRALSSLRADLFIVIAFRMLPREVWSMPPMGTFNLHASLLPDYRGAAPIQRAILGGESETGVTTFLLDEEIDNGRILLQRSIPIASDETGGTLHDKLMELGKELVPETIELLREHGSALSYPQPEVDPAETKPAPKIFREDRLLSFTHSSALDIERRVRAMSPYPGCIALWDRGGETYEIKVFAVETTRERLPAGEVRATSDGRLLVGTVTEAISITSLQMPSKHRVSSTELLNGLHTEELGSFS